MVTISTTIQYIAISVDGEHIAAMRITETDITDVLTEALNSHFDCETNIKANYNIEFLNKPFTITANITPDDEPEYKETITIVQSWLYNEADTPAPEKFPNGFEDWHETHYQVVVEIEKIHDIEQQHTRTDLLEGTGDRWAIAKTLTDKFEQQYKGATWGENLDYGDTLDAFLDAEIYGCTDIKKHLHLTNDSDELAEVLEDWFLTWQDDKETTEEQYNKMMAISERVKLQSTTDEDIIQIEFHLSQINEGREGDSEYPHYFLKQDEAKNYTYVLLGEDACIAYHEGEKQLKEFIERGEGFSLQSYCSTENVPSVIDKVLDDVQGWYNYTILSKREYDLIIEWRDNKD